MTSLPMERAGAIERLQRARSAVRSAVESPSGVEPGVVTSPTPIKALPDDVGSIVVARADAGLTPAGSDFPRNPLLRRVAAPSAVLALLDLVLLVIALIAGSGLLAAVSLVLLVAFGAATVLAARYAAADPLRLGPHEQAAIAEAGRWTPKRDWSDGRAATADGALVAAAATAAQRIVLTPAWTTGALARCGVVLALSAELDQVETLSAQVSAEDEDWTRLVVRVAALTAYADTVEHLADAGPDGEPAQDDIEVLAFFLSTSIYDVP